MKSKKEMNEQMKRLLEAGQYKDAEKICMGLDFISIRDLIMELAYDTESLSVYSFVRYMKKSTSNIEWMELAVDVMLNPLCSVEGAYSVALFHARELLSNARTVDNLERILFFYNIPEQLVTEKEAKEIAREILEVDPDNKAAKAAI